MTVHEGRFTADIDGDFVVFLIGMRFNQPWKVRQWAPVFVAMPKMLRAIGQHPELGCLGSEQWVGRTTLLLQYWRDFESLDRFAKDRDLPHLEPWRRFNAAARATTAVGVWHETYQVRAGEHEAVYVNMPPFGLARAGEHVPVGRRGESAAEPIGREPR
jgi:hypothetical protein